MSSPFYGYPTTGVGITSITSTDQTVTVTPNGGTVDIAAAWVPPEYRSERLTPVTTSVAPASAVEYLLLDDGSGGDITLTSGFTWSLSGSVFVSVSAANAALYLHLQINTEGGGWVDSPAPAVVDQRGVTSGAAAETAFAGLPPGVIGVGVKFRFVIALHSGPGGATVTAEQGVMHISRVSKP